MGDKLRQVIDIVRRDPAVAVGRRLHRRRARGRRLHVRRAEARGRAHRARPRGDRAAAAAAREHHGPAHFPAPVQDVRAGGRSSNSTYQYTLKGENSADLREWSRKLMDELKTHPRADRHRQRPAGERRRDQRQRRPRPRPRDSASARTPSTRRCTTRSASGRWRRSTPSSTSTTSSWNGRRNTRRARTRCPTCTCQARRS